MNYHGNIKSVTLHTNSIRDISMTNLEFNEDGWLTSFVHTTYQGAKINNRIIYDSQYRIERLVGNDDIGETCDISFTYGEDTRYIPTEYLFYFIAYDANADLMAWCPQYMRGLEKITVRSGFGFTYEFRVDLTKGTITQYEAGADYPPYIWDLTFDGDFPTGHWADNWGDVQIFIELDKNTGMLKTFKTEDDWGWSELIYNADRLNSINTLKSDWQEQEFTYNDNLDLTLIDDKLRPDNSLSYTYSYDSQGNWVTVSENGVVQSRTIEYW